MLNAGDMDPTRASSWENVNFENQIPVTTTETASPAVEQPEAGTKDSSSLKNRLSGFTARLKLPSGALPVAEGLKESAARLSHDLRESSARTARSAQEAVERGREAAARMTLEAKAKAETKMKEIGAVSSNLFHLSGSFSKPEKKSSKVFGVPLEARVEWESSHCPVPQVLLACAHHLSAAGMQTDWLFMEDGSDEVKEKLIAHFERGHSCFPDGVSARDVAGVLKTYLAMLPEPLLTFKLWPVLVACAGGDEPDRVWESVVARLPEGHYASLRLVLALLARTAAHAAHNQMDAHTLSLVFAPLLARPPNPITPQQPDANNTLSSDEDQQTTPAEWEVEAVAVVVQHMVKTYLNQLERKTSLPHTPSDILPPSLDHPQTTDEPHSQTSSSPVSTPIVQTTVANNVSDDENSGRALDSSNGHSVDSPMVRVKDEEDLGNDKAKTTCHIRQDVATVDEELGKADVPETQDLDQDDTDTFGNSANDSLSVSLSVDKLNNVSVSIHQ